MIKWRFHFSSRYFLLFYSCNLVTLHSKLTLQTRGRQELAHSCFKPVFTIFEKFNFMIARWTLNCTDNLRLLNSLNLDFDLLAPFGRVNSNQKRNPKAFSIVDPNPNRNPNCRRKSSQTLVRSQLHQSLALKIGIGFKIQGRLQIRG